ncbi:peptide chain release factor N(5)-glutamine methyltransferase [Streptococcus loxodontisalivarius]|uniref:Release factor glutamine methyltransferase n=1 Tax=Streptococcus loxodontisalivarius TaxID=1349415 RepID=A0ABS2PPP9_9STRE|nr:peptide chain release factor N(5)-glutamine methyltransferase [Streptococcus loxodontisalivarius]MBM7642018.1 release factor glutamine methyltransferase [Streptococcus loxodontisalivarius]
MRYGYLFSHYEEELEKRGEEGQALSYVFKEVKDWSQTDFVLHLGQEASQEDQDLLESLFEQLAAHKPAQYITGKAYFRDLELAVDERVLIPRPETEELVDMILQENSRADLTVLDIGTGSGAIALSLAKAQPSWQVLASDLSSDALNLAQQNAKANQLDLAFCQSDVFDSIDGQFDIIVSNPPYISYDDKEEVGLNVLTSEPHLALFADEDGFAIYRKILENAKAHLKADGKIYFEIGYKQADGIRALAEKHLPEMTVRIVKDLWGKDRMVVISHG